MLQTLLSSSGTQAQWLVKAAMPRDYFILSAGAGVGAGTYTIIAIKASQALLKSEIAKSTTYWSELCGEAICGTIGNIWGYFEYSKGLLSQDQTVPNTAYYASVGAIIVTFISLNFLYDIYYGAKSEEINPVMVQEAQKLLTNPTAGSLSDGNGLTRSVSSILLGTSQSISPVPTEEKKPPIEVQAGYSPLADSEEPYIETPKASETPQPSPVISQAQPAKREPLPLPKGLTRRTWTEPLYKLVPPISPIKNDKILGREEYCCSAEGDCCSISSLKDSCTIQ